MQKDPYRYFRIEVRELIEGLSRGALDLERGGDTSKAVTQLLRVAHTLKGAARVVKQTKIAEAAHAIETLLAPYREAGSDAPSRGQVDELLALLDVISRGADALDGAPVESSKATSGAPADSLADRVRVEVSEVDALIETLLEARAKVTLLRRDLAALAARDAHDSFDHTLGALVRSVEALDRDLSDADAVAQRVRLLPASELFTALDRATRDAANASGKQVEFRAAGGEHRVDGQVLFAMRDAMMHLVRNSVVHGIERVGVVRVLVERRGARIAFVVSDDGRGIDVEAVRRLAKERRLLDNAAIAKLDGPGALALINRGGLSTSAALTELSGRGVGLGVAQDIVASLRGEWTMTSEPGRGTRIEMVVPITASSVEALIAESSGMSVAIPLSAVKRTLLAGQRDAIVRTPTGHAVTVEGESLALISLAAMLGRPTTQRVEDGVVVVVEHDDRRAALVAETLASVETILVRPLPELAGAHALFIGASLDAVGDPRVLLDPAGIVNSAGRAVIAAEPSVAQVVMPVLVVDDSLTTRMLEQSILESAGYVVETATSAEEALERIRGRRFALFLVDVEMPGMTGFDFVAAIRADREQRDTPAILVTSRNAPEDLLRGTQVGANAYMVKSEFDQEKLLETIRTLVRR